MNPGDTVVGSYVLKERLGKSLFGETWAAVAGDGCALAAPGTELVLKTLALAEAPDWKSLELIERETAALKSMANPSVPRYVDAFKLDGPGGAAFALVMERMPGRSLAAEVESGKRFTEVEIETMFARLLSILAYIHSLRPPIIHRDVNPKNVILRPDGAIALVDFSGVQDAVRLAYRDTSTMIGTAGYAPLEQVSGRATVRSDLYAAAATAAFLLTLKHPSDLPVSGMRIDPGALVAPSPRLEYVFGFYLDPDEAKRALDPLDAAAILLGERPVPAAAPNQGLAMPDGSAAVRQRAEPIAENSLAGTFGRLAERLVEGLESRIKSGNGPYGDGSGIPEPVFGEAAAGTGHASAMKAAPDSLPSDSRVIMSTSPGLFSLAIPRNGLKSPGFWLSSGFAVFWLGFVAFWTFSALVMGAPIFFAMFSLPFWAVGIFLVKSLVKPALTSIAASVTKEGGLVFEERFLGKPRVRSWPLSDIGACRIENSPISQNGRHDRDLCIEAGAKEVRFGRSLSERERRAVASALNLWLSEARGAS